MSAAAAIAGQQGLWFLSRASGLTLLIATTSVLVLGIAARTGAAPGRLPQFVSAELHRNLALFSVAFLVLHVVTALLDPFVTIGWAATVLPFLSGYRPLAIGMGALAVDLGGAVLLTSLLRGRLGYRRWRAVHWLAYLAWPVAFAHSLTAGGDLHIWWVALIEWGCGAAAATALLARAFHALAHRDSRGSRARLGGQARAGLRGACGGHPVTRAPDGLARYTTAGQPGPVPGRPAAPPGLPRLLPVTPSGQPASLAAHLARYGPRPAVLTERSRTGLLREVQESGLTGRGGAAFPAFVKLSTVAAGQDPVVIANGTEGEPASFKDKILLTSSPHLVLDGAVLAAELTGARQVIVVAHRDAVTAVSAAAAERGRPGRGRVRITVRAAAVGFVAREARAVVNWLEHGRPVPTPAYPRLFERGLGGAPTLLHNVETLAHLALIGRYGAAWFRSAGTSAEPGSMLVTVLGAVREPSVLEIGIGTPVRDILALAGGPAVPLQALLLGGYFGGWARVGEVASLPFSAAGLADAGAAPGAGLIAALPTDACGLAETARVVRYLADSSAGQCGPCLFGLDAVAGQVEQLAHGGHDALPLLRRWLGQVDKRGACAHPDGAVRLVRSALRVFASELDQHNRGWCRGTRPDPVLPVPPRRDR